MAAYDKLFRILFEHSPIGQAVMDSSGRMSQTNLAVQRIFRLTVDELRTRSIQTFIHPEDLPEYERLLNALAGDDTPSFSFIGRIRNAQEQELWLRIDVANVASEGFSPFVFATIDDITRQKNDEERLKRDKESAEKATQTKSAFLANMSHEIRTPIHTITGMTELLLQTKLDEEQKEYANQVQFSADVLLSLINDILDFSKIEAGKLGLEIIDCLFAQLVEDTVEMLSLLAHKKGLEVILDIPPSVPEWIQCDPVRVRQVIINLFNNAIKFTQKGEIVIRARNITARDGRRSILVEVSDTGIGIPDEKRALLFNAFTQIDSSTTRKFGGTGLGLSICRSLVAMWGGSIGVKSAPGSGSTFWFTLPEKPCEGRTNRTLEGVEDFKSNKVLIVDDNDSSRKLLFHNLSAWFHRVESAMSGADGLARLHKAAESGEPFDIAVIDLLMPGMDGWQLASEINSNKTINSTKLVLMSPTGAGAEAKMKLLGWFDGYVSKPVRLHAFFDCLDSALSTELDLEGAETLEDVAPDQAAPGPLYRPTIMVAEDHIVNQQLFRTILERMGYPVVLASDGSQAVEMAGQHPIELVFMDIQMPVMNGWEASSELRRRGFDKPIIAVTANALSGEKEKCLELGMNDYLTKPFKPNDLLSYLAKWLGGGRPAPAGPAASTRQTAASEQKPAAENPLPPEAVFDLGKATEAFMGKTDVVVRVVKAFLPKLESQMTSMAAALEKGDWDPLRIESHGIKGGCWNLEARPLGDAAGRLEQAAKDHDAAAAGQALAEVRKAFTEFRQRVASLPEFRA